MNKPLKCLSYVGVASVLSLGFAQDDQFDTVIVFGNAEKEGDALVQSKEISNLQANTLQDMFQNTPSVFVSGGRDVSQMVFVNGMGSTFSNTTIDGAYQSNFYHHAGYLLIEPELLKQVGINSGAGSALDGLGALNGSIKFETKSALDLLGEKDFYGLAKVTGYSNGEGFKFSQVFANRLNDNWSLLLNGAHAELDDFEGGSGVKYANSGSDTTSYFAKLSADYEAHQFSASYENIDRTFFGFARLNYTGGFSLPSGNDRGQQSQERDVFGINYDFTPGGDLINFEADLSISSQTFNGVDNDNVGNDDDTADLDTIDLTLTNTSYVSDSTSVAYGLNIRQIDAAFQDDARVTEEEKAYGIFAQADVDLTDSFSTSFGGRFDSWDYTDSGTSDAQTDRYNFKDEKFSPNISVTYAPLDNLELSVGYAEAFRGVGIREAIYLDSNRDDAATVGVDERTLLEGEESNSLEAAVSYWADNGFYVRGSVFKQEIDNYLDEVEGQNAEFLSNIDLENKGYEISFGYEDKASYYSLTVTDNDHSSNTPETVTNSNYNLGDEGIGRFQTGRRWLATVGHKLQDQGLNLGLSAEYQEGQDETSIAGEVDVKEKKSFVVFNAFAQWDVASVDGLKVQLNVDNIFDRGYYEATYYPDDRIYEEPGRQFRLGLSYEF